MVHVSRLQFHCTRPKKNICGNDRIGTGTDLYELGALPCRWKWQRAQPSACCRGIYCKDKRIKYCLLDSNEGIAGNTNEALKMADGDFVVLTDHDDLLSPEALYQCAKAVQKEPQTDVIYSDEDKVDMSGKKFFEPHFKSDYNIDLLCTMNYICHLFVVRKDVMERAGLFESCYDGAQDHDFILRCTEKQSISCIFRRCCIIGAVMHSQPPRIRKASYMPLRMGAKR